MFLHVNFINNCDIIATIPIDFVRAFTVIDLVRKLAWTAMTIWWIVVPSTMVLAANRIGIRTFQINFYFEKYTQLINRMENRFEYSVRQFMGVIFTV